MPNTLEDLAELWQPSRLGSRLLAVAAAHENPRLTSWPMLREGIVGSRFAFEQYHALVLAKREIPTPSDPERAELRDAVKSQLGRRFPPEGDHGTVARDILRSLVH